MTAWAFTSLSESPGATTTALAVAASCEPPALVVEADPFGGSLAARFGLGARPGIASLAAARRDRSGEALRSHAQCLPGGLEVVVGLPSAAQSPALAGDWESLAGAFTKASQLVVVDAGRFTASDPAPLPVLRAAGVLAVVLRPELSQIARLRAAAATLAETNASVAAVLVGERPYGPAEVSAATGIEVAGVIAHDPGAAALMGGAPGSARALRRSALARSGAALAASLAARSTTPAAPEPGEGAGVVDLNDAGVDAVARSEEVLR